MRLPGIFFICLLVGCSSLSPPDPPLPEGEYRPINTAPPSDVFNFTYDGDILGVLPALKIAAIEEFDVKPTQGKAKALRVRLNLRGVRLEDALRAISEQGGDVADVIWNAGINQAYIRFRVPPKSTGTKRRTN